MSIQRLPDRTIVSSTPMIDQGLPVMTGLSDSKGLCFMTICIVGMILTLTLRPLATADELPAVSERLPVAAPHFPDTVHAFVWRNWQLVEPQRLAAVLGTTADNVTELAVSMGLPRKVSVPREMPKRGYITLVRRNWHLLPYDQLTQLLGITPAEFAFRLREDDALYTKLGLLKPRCERLEYKQPNDRARQRAAEIKNLVQREFGDQLNQPAEPRFGFVASLSRPPDPQPAIRKHDSMERLRFIYSYFAMFGDPLADSKLDPFPDGLLARLSAQGVNGIWLHTVLRQLAPGGPDFPEFGDGHEARLANLRKLVQRAKRYGIDVYLYVNEPRAMPKAFFEHRPEMAGVEEGEYVAMCTSNPRVRRWVGDSLTYVFREVPDLGGVFTITASENLTNCASHNHRRGCPHCAQRTDAEIQAEINTVISDGVHRAAPAAKVIAWDWGWNGHGDARNTIALLPNSVWLMSVSEWALPIERGGIKSVVGEYSMSAVGPGPRATQHWDYAKQRGLKTVAKVQLNNTWELSAVPYLPVLDLVAEHCDRLAKADVDGMMLSWSLGGYPSLNLELAQEFAARPAPNASTALQAVAERHFGPQAAPLVRQAWTKFSRAFREYPYSGAVLYNAPQQMGPANLLYGQPTRYSAMRVGIPYDDLNGWRGPYPPQNFAAQFQKVADGWAEGLVDLEAAQSLVPADLRAAAVADLRVAHAAQLHFASVANQTRFIMVRDALLAAQEDANTDSERQKLTSILDREIELAKRLFQLASADSRLGYEASNQYYYVPLDLVEKVIDCDYLKSHIGKNKSGGGKSP
jgi:hypothetical protein